jgi:kumamolisin
MREVSRKVVWIVLSLAAVGCNSDSNSNNPNTCNIPAAKPMTENFSSQMTSHIPAKVQDLADEGKVSEDEPLPVTLSLPLNNDADLDQKLGAIYQPGNPSFHQFMTPAEFHNRYAPTAGQIETVRAYLESQGIQVTSVNDNGYLVKAQASVGVINTAFQTEIHRYRAADGNEYFAPSTEPQLPFGIQAVHGLQNVSRLKSYARAQSLGSNAETEHSGSGPNGGLSPSDIHNAYNVSSSTTGAGQTLALFELDGYTASDITNYERQFGLPSVPLQNVLVDGATGAPGGGATEVTLDIELMTAIAPGASRIMVYEGPNESQAVLDLYARIANDNIAKQISSSWGDAEADNSASFLQAENVIFKQMAAQGQAFYASAGDAGADDNGSSLSVDDPGSQPYVVSVGGTHLVSGPGGSYLNETTWNNGSPSYGAGGGGISVVWTQPSWQNGVVSAQSKASQSMRNVPDVSLNADPQVGYAIFVGGGWTIFGGTSCAAPLWAGFTALVNQKRAAEGSGVLGFPSPYLYAVGIGARYDSDFHDIADGSTNLFYPAVKGYDDATGWGSFNGQNLLADLSADAPIAPPSNAGQFTCQ